MFFMLLWWFALWLALLQCVVCTIATISNVGMWLTSCGMPMHYWLLSSSWLLVCSWLAVSSPLTPAPPTPITFKIKPTSILWHSEVISWKIFSKLASTQILLPCSMHLRTLASWPSSELFKFPWISPPLPPITTQLSHKFKKKWIPTPLTPTLYQSLMSLTINNLQ